MATLKAVKQSKSKSDPAEAAVTAPQLRDTDRTREKIIRHATKEIAAKGFDGARVDKIAASCRLSKNTLYYHFKSKEGLFTAVLEGMYERLRKRQDDLDIPFDRPEAAIKEFARQTFWAFADNPDIIRLLNDENLHGARHIKKSTVLRSLYDPLVDVVSKILSTGQDAGVFKKNLDAVSIYIVISSISYHFLSNRYTLELTLNRDMSSVEAYKAWSEYVADVAVVVCKNLDPGMMPV